MTEAETRTWILKMARVIHLAKLKSCYFPGHPGWSGLEAAMLREPWPEDRKEAERLLQEGQSWMEIAIDQAKAVLKELDQSND